MVQYAVQYKRGEPKESHHRGLKLLERSIESMNNAMTFEFDHLFILTDIGASEANRLSSFGLVEGASRIHRGQGTANRSFFFHNAMLELLSENWLENPVTSATLSASPSRTVLIINLCCNPADIVLKDIG